MLAPPDPLDFGCAPNCSGCLRPMDAVVGAWWCSTCRLAERPEQTSAQDCS